MQVQEGKENTFYAVLGIGSQTEAQRARRLLAGLHNISVVKVENRMKDGGCLYGIRIRRSDLGEAVRTLRENRVYSSVIGG